MAYGKTGVSDDKLACVSPRLFCNEPSTKAAVGLDVK
jgi:hypothetical protein